MHFRTKPRMNDSFENPQYLFGKTTPVKGLVYLVIFAFVFYVGYKMLIVNRISSEAETAYQVEPNSPAQENEVVTTDNVQVTTNEIRDSLMAYFPEQIDLNYIKSQNSTVYTDLVAFADQNDISIKSGKLPRDPFVNALVGEVNLEPIDEEDSAEEEEEADSTGEVKSATTEEVRWEYVTPVASTSQGAGGTESTDGSGNPLLCFVNATVDVQSCEMPRFFDSWVGFKANYRDPRGCTREGEFVMAPLSKMLPHSQMALRSPTPDIDTGQLSQIFDYPEYEVPVVPEIGFNACTADGKVMPPGLLSDLISSLTGAERDLTGGEVGMYPTTYATNDSGENGGKGLITHQLEPAQTAQDAGEELTFEIPRAPDAPLRVKPLEVNTSPSERVVAADDARLPKGGIHDAVRYFNVAQSSTLDRVVGLCTAAALGYTNKCNWHNNTAANTEETTGHNQNLPGFDNMYVMWRKPDEPDFFTEDGTEALPFKDAVTKCNNSLGGSEPFNVYDNAEAVTTILSITYSRTLPPHLATIYHQTDDVSNLYFENGAYITNRGPETDQADFFYESAFTLEDDPIIECSNSTL
jgi:hypothetical protein